MEFRCSSAPTFLPPTAILVRKFRIPLDFLTALGGGRKSSRSDSQLRSLRNSKCSRGETGDREEQWSALCRPVRVTDRVKTRASRIIQWDSRQTRGNPRGGRRGREAGRDEEELDGEDREIEDRRGAAAHRPGLDLLIPAADGSAADGRWRLLFVVPRHSCTNCLSELFRVHRRF